MNLLALKVTLQCYFGFNYWYVGIIAVVVMSSTLVFKYASKGKLTRGDISVSMLFALYFTLLIGVMLLNREVDENRRINWDLFWSYRKCFVEGDVRLLEQMIFNVIAFIPWPILYAQVFPKMKKFLWGVGSAFLFSLFVEIAQLVFKVGLFEFDDMFHNTLGAVIGYGILSLGRVIISRYRLRKSN